MKRIAIVLPVLVLLVLAGCGENGVVTYNDKDEVKKSIEGIEISQENFPDDTLRDYVADEFDENDDGFLSDNEYVYNVDCFLEEDISEVPLKVLEVASYKNGNVYNIRIDYDDCEGRYFWGVTDRFNLGVFYVTDENIYWISDAEDVPTEEEFRSNGFVIYSNEDSEQNIDGEKITIENSDDTCRCVISNTLTESGFYSIFEWSKDRELTYYSSGYGAGGDLIELELEKN